MRARTHAGNLAHALKTPLSVMVNEAAAHSGEPFADKVREQTEIMRDQVARHLERARLAARVAVVGTVTEVRAGGGGARPHHGEDLPGTPIVDRDRRRRRRAVSRRAAGPRGNGRQPGRQCLQVGAVARRDRSAVRTSEPGDDRTVVRIVVDDDGPGLSPQQREQVAKRGRRLDETKPGSGLGLSIVMELAGLYGGALTLSNAPLGGLRVELMLPGV